MELVTGYFISRAPAFEASRLLINKGYKIKIFGHENQEDFRKKSGLDNDDGSGELGIPYYGMLGSNAGLVSGINTFSMQAGGPVFGVLPVLGLTNYGPGNNFGETMREWGVPIDVEHEIRKVVEAGSSVVLVECETSDKSQVCNLLKSQGAQNIHA